MKKVEIEELKNIIRHYSRTDILRDDDERAHAQAEVKRAERKLREAGIDPEPYQKGW